MALAEAVEAVDAVDAVFFLLTPLTTLTLLTPLTTSTPLTPGGSPGGHPAWRAILSLETFLHSTTIMIPAMLSEYAQTIII